MESALKQINFPAIVTSVRQATAQLHEATGEVPTVTQLVEATGLTAKRLWRVR